MFVYHSQYLRQALLTLHFIGLAFGLGGAAIADFSFFKTLKMVDRITPETVGWMRSFSQVVWAGLGILLLSGIGLFLMQPSQFTHSPGFLAKMLFVAILIVNGLFLNYYTTARLTTFNFSERYPRHDAAWSARKLSFVFGAISTVTWYAALTVALFKGVLGLSFMQYVLAYLLVLGLAISSALLLERTLTFRKSAPLNATDRLVPVATSPSLTNQPATLPAQVAPIAVQPAPQISIVTQPAASTQPANPERPVQPPPGSLPPTA